MNAHLTPAPAGPQPPVPGDWLAIHVFYSANPAPMLVECVAPLIRELQRRQLLHGWFFIRYWMEGPHVRLRLRPITAAHAEEVKALAEAAVREFLRRRPAVYDIPRELVADMYKELFLAEYTQEEWDAKYGADGTMPVRDNNSFAYLDYEPEYDRYGGQAGIELAEWHFQRSSELVLRLLESANMHVRTVMLGTAAQLMTVACRIFLPEQDACVEYLRNYSSYWERTFLDDDPKRVRRFDDAYDEMGGSLARRVGEISDLVLDRRFDRLSTFVRDWALHYVELRDRIAALVADGSFVFPDRGGSGVRVLADDLGLTLQVELSSYLHMTNNRLGLAIGDEVYLSHVVRRATIEYGERGAEVPATTVVSGA